MPASAVKPLAPDGAPDPQGQIVLLSIGMSNTRRAFDAFMATLNGDAGVNPRIVAVNGAINGQAASDIDSPGAPYWSQLSPEPHAYHGGFTFKWLVEERIDGALDAPWLAWGPYLWADGVNPRGDGLVWLCEDFDTDGTHPSALGEQKVADRLLEFFKSDSTTAPWFLIEAPAPDVPQNLRRLDVRP